MVLQFASLLQQITAYVYIHTSNKKFLEKNWVIWTATKRTEQGVDLQRNVVVVLWGFHSTLEQ